MQSEDNDAVETSAASLDDFAEPLLSERSRAFKRTLRLIFLFDALLSLYSVLGPYPLLVAGPVLLSVAAVCICAGVVLLGAPKDAPVIGKDVAVAVFPWLLACGILANGALDHSSEVLYQPVVLRTAYQRRWDLVVVQSWRPGRTTESLYIRRPFLFGRGGFYFLPGKTIIVGMKPGALSMPWITRVSR
jgi:hypothetical protein